MSISGADTRSAITEITMSKSRVVKCRHASLALMPIAGSGGSSDESIDTAGREAELPLPRAPSTDPGRVGTFAGVRLSSIVGSEFASHCFDLDGMVHLRFAEPSRLQNMGNWLTAAPPEISTLHHLYDRV